MIGIYVYILTAVFFAGLGIWYSKRKKWNVEEFISSKNSLTVWGSVATIFASGMGAWLLFGPAETLLWNGVIAVIGYALASMLSLWMFIWLGSKIRQVVPKGHSLIEYVLHRFGKGMYMFVLIVSIFFMGLGMAAELTGISLAGKVVFGIPLWISALVIILGVLLYVMIGGFKASVFTDKVQTIFILPLFGILVVGMLMFSGNIMPSVMNEMPELFNLGRWDGIELAIVLIIAIVAAELFNQSWWQRVYSAKDEKTLKKGYFIAGLLVLPIIIIAGLLGLYAVGTNAVNDPSVALFSVLLGMPQWLLITGMVLAVALVMSSLDTTLNAMISIFTVDFARLKPNVEVKKLLGVAKVIVFIIAIIGLGIAMKAMSVFYLFLLADLLTVAIVFPVFYSLYEKKLNGKVALVASMLGLIGGLLIFPEPNFSGNLISTFTGWKVFNGYANLLWSFVIGLVIPMVISIVFSYGKDFNYSSLKKKVNLLR